MLLNPSLGTGKKQWSGKKVAVFITLWKEFIKDIREFVYFDIHAVFSDIFMSWSDHIIGGECKNKIDEEFELGASYYRVTYFVINSAIEKDALNINSNGFYDNLLRLMYLHNEKVGFIRAVELIKKSEFQIIKVSSNK
jgi:hypothetical protein